MHLLHLTTGNEITRSSGVSLCLAGKGYTGGSLPLPKQAPADPARASGALCQADKPCQVDKPSVAWFAALCRQLAGLARGVRAYRCFWSRDRRVGQLRATRANLSFGLA